LGFFFVNYPQNALKAIKTSAILVLRGWRDWLTGKGGEPPNGKSP